jgi:iron complex outermembrane receptor protein
VVIRGFQRENLFIVFDDAPFFGAVPFRIDAPPFHLNPADISRITVTRGPFNLGYPGSAGGTVEVEGRENPPGTGGRVSATAASYDAFETHAHVSVSGDQGDAGVGYLFRTSQVPETGNGKLLTETPYPNPNNNYRPEDQDRSMFRSQTLWFRGGAALPRQGRAEVAYSYNEGDDLLTPTFNFDAPHQESHRLTGRLELRDLSPTISGLILQGWYGHATCLVDDALRETADPGNTSLPYRTALSRSYSTRLDFTAITSGGRATTSLNLGSSTLTTGLDFYQRDWDGSYNTLSRGTGGWAYRDDLTVIPDVTTRNTGAHATLETMVTPNVRLVTALRGDLAQVDANGITSQGDALYQAYHGRNAPHDRDFTLFSGSAQIHYAPLPGVELFLKGGRANRLPDPHELYMTQVRQGSNLVGSPFLDPSTVTEVDGGFVLSSPRAGLELTLYYSDIQDYILPVFSDPDGAGPIPPARTARNVDASLRGLEGKAHILLCEGLTLAGGIAYTHGTNRTAGEPLAEMQPLRGSLSLRYETRRFFASVTENLAARQDRIDPTLNETESSGFATTDLRLGYRIASFSVVGGITNLFGKQYYLPLAYQRDPVNPSVRIPENGRAFHLTASYRF